MDRIVRLAVAAAGLFSIGAPAALAQSAGAKAPAGIERVQNVVVLYLENRSFDHLFGNFPGAEGLSRAGKRAIQTGEDGKRLAFLPDALDLRTSAKPRYDKLPDKLANRPYRLNDYYRMDEVLGSLVHAFHTQQNQINGGKMDRFALYSDARGYAMAYWDGSTLRLWDYAKRYTLADHFFHAAFGGSFLNHQWLICACTPVYPGADMEKIGVKFDAQGKLVREGYVTQDGYAVNTLQPVGGPFDPKGDPALRLPVQDQPTIGDRLSAKNVAWAWYSGGWNEAEAGQEKPGTFSYHHQPFAFFKRFQKGGPDRQRHLKDLDDFVKDIDAGTLPPVAFYKPRSGINQHPSGSDVVKSDAHAADLLDRLVKSKQWPGMVVIVTYDENGGFWDHVPPPKRDRWGPGTRVPTIVVSPFARKGHVDHTSYDTTAILKLIELRWGLDPLGTADAAAKPLTGALRFR
ncbi:MAG: acid phosphatase [Alphaproteobacteria bacterium]|nr:acid phosphatase [Alphaproteobacteria bacterium]